MSYNIPENHHESLPRKEEWRLVVIDGESWPYEVSDLGRVRRSEPPWKDGKTHVGKIMRLQTVTGYWKVHLRDGGRNKQCLVHRLVAEAFLGPCPEGMQVNHKDRNRTNATVNNLEYVTPKQNAVRGSDVGGAKLTEEKVLALREEAQALLDKYGISKGTLYNVLTGRTWGWLDG